ncbi:MAG: family 20 glycosylhydrolase [Cellulophaga sp.]|uniref:family 20 glycosylhydrolase n=1 Tax=Cellulophaga sp. TaxID=1972202 RepID=UPI0032671CC1
MKNSILFRTLLTLIGIFTIIACQEKRVIINYPTTDLSAESMVPLPLKVTPTNSAFGLDKNTAIYTSKNSGFEQVGSFLSNKISSKINLEVPVNSTNPETSKIIYINKTDSLELDNKEAYQMYITQDSIIINAKTAAGAFRGIQTLRQIIPEESNDTLTAHKMWLIPSGKILDQPNYEYRGAMLDVARHFFSVDDVKKYIDILAYYKFNALHLHLTDDQGWRIEIKSWPKLTEIGASTEVGGGPGGFYTQEDFKELVRYAEERHIIIVPEVDMPGHTNAATVAYPQLNGNGKTPKIYTGMRVGFSTLDTDKDLVYAFVDDVVREISAISPAPYFHLGGDESHVTKKKDFKKFILKVSKIVESHGKTPIGWDEIATTDISSNSVAQFWRSKKNAKLALGKGMKIILSPAKKAYLDMQYDTLSKHGLHWATYIPVDSAYIWTPETFVKELPKEQVLGIEAPLWSETISNIEELEYLAFPRIIGYSELNWTIKENRNWKDYKIRLANQAPYLERMNVKYYPTKLIDWKKSKHTFKEIDKD